ncbi:protein kinase domain containing protein, partial [Entamoeba invadens IP1]
KLGCEDCSNGISITQKCGNRQEKCKYYIQNRIYNISNCLSCEDNYTLTTENNCLSSIIDNPNIFLRNNMVYICDVYNYLNNENMCKPCLENSEHMINKCRLVSDKGVSILKAIQCEESRLYDQNETTCFVDEKCVTTMTNDCVKCDNTSHYYIHENRCVLKEIDNCVKYLQNNCLQCKEKFLVTDGICREIEYFHCEKSNGILCTNCYMYYYRELTIQSNNLTYCTSKEDKQIKYATSIQNGPEIVLECNEKYTLFNNTCSFPQSVNVNLKISNDNNTCEVSSSKGCLKCIDGYYLSVKNECVSCENSQFNCLTCKNETYCISCNKNTYFLNSNNKCELSSELSKRCQVMMPSNTGCVSCKDKYFKDGQDCVACDISCETCQEVTKCLSCADNYFQIAGESPLCLNYDNLTNCVKKSKSGCLLCAGGYYLGTVIPRCIKCSSNCALCISEEYCSLCESNFILINEVCNPLAVVQYCVSEKNNLCDKCEGNRIPSDDGLSCVDQPNYILIISVTVALIFIVFAIIITSILIVYLTKLKHKKNEERKKVCVFNMKKSNINFSKLSKKLVVNLPELIFENDSNDNRETTEIPVSEETRELLCIGNISKNNLKIQLSVIANCELYNIRTVPPLVTLKKNEACEFEIFLNPTCTCEIDDEILCISLDIKKGEQTTNKIKIKAKTILTTKLNNSDLTENEKLGEGSFGVVYKGIFRGSVVAIKRLKNGCTDKSSTKEFANEVAMLDKFRCEYIVYFYGAVFTPKKICLVTEFAKYKSLNDLIKKTENDPNLKPNKKVRHRFILDMANGIFYLHNNGILHRDVKPANLLIFSYDLEETILAKLTDFGSSRNLNQLMTNMTFTKGIGTPAYMAPEILKKERYQMPSDIYSFAITMYETFEWRAAYSKDKFKFAWCIADFVSNGNRFEKDDNISSEEFDIIQKAWCAEPDKRTKINEIIDALKSLV